MNVAPLCVNAEAGRQELSPAIYAVVNPPDADVMPALVLVGQEAVATLVLRGSHRPTAGPEWPAAFNRAGTCS